MFLATIKGNQGLCANSIYLLVHGQMLRLELKSSRRDLKPKISESKQFHWIADLTIVALFVTSIRFCTPLALGRLCSELSDSWMPDTIVSHLGQNIQVKNFDSNGHIKEVNIKIQHKYWRMSYESGLQMFYVVLSCMIERLCLFSSSQPRQKNTVLFGPSLNTKIRCISQ